MKNNIISSITIVGSILMILLSAVSCVPQEFVGLNATYNPIYHIDTLTFEAWSLGNLVRKNTVVFYQTSSNIQNGQYEEIPILRYEGGRNVSTEAVFTSLSSEYDSVRFTRSSDGASTITYRHDEDASEEQCSFFKRVAWSCEPDDNGYEGSRTYTLNLTDDMFH